MAGIRIVAAAATAAAALVGAGIALAHRGRHAATRAAPGGILMPDPGLYDRLSGPLLGSLFGPIARDVAALAAPGAGRVLEVGCGPGHLSIRLATEHELDVTALDLDPEMIERARANAERAGRAGGRAPVFHVGDVAALPFPDGSFDLVVSTFSMHHWDDPVAGLAEIGRVLRHGGRAIVWDLRHGFSLFHFRSPDPLDPVRASPLRLVSASAWPWPWRFSIAQRIELAPPGS